MKEKLDNPKYQSWYELYKNIADGEMSLDDIADISGIDVGGVRIKKMRLEQFLTQFVENGDLPEYIRRKAGVKVKFPSNKFSFSAKGEKEATGEPMYIFQADPNNPNGGEWVEMGKPKPGKGSTQDTLGDVAFGKGEDEEPLSEIRNMIRETLEKL